MLKQLLRVVSPELAVLYEFNSWVEAYPEIEAEPEVMSDSIALAITTALAEPTQVVFEQRPR
jgi:hypothetical protein